MHVVHALIQFYILSLPIYLFTIGGSTRSSTPSLFSSSQRAATPISPSQDDASSMDSSRDTFDDLLNFMSTKTPAPGSY